MSVTKCIGENDIEALKALIADEDDDVVVFKWTALRLAVIQQRVEMVYFLLDAGASFDKDIISQCLYSRVEYTHYNRRILEKDILMLRALLHHDHSFRDECVEFFDAVGNGMLHQASILIDHGALVQSINNMQAITEIYDWRKAVGESSVCLLHVRSTRWLNHDVMDLLAQHVWSNRLMYRDDFMREFIAQSVAKDLNE